MRKSLTVLAVFLSFLICTKVFGKYGGGTGEPEDPYLIANGSHLQSLGATEEDWDMYFKMVDDISLDSYTGISFNIIGNSTDRFTGVFDGDGHKIYGFNYITHTSYGSIGIFGIVRGTIKKIVVVSPIVNCPESYSVGGLVGTLEQSGKVTECASINGFILGKYSVGGLCGRSTSSGGFKARVEDCYSTCSVEGERAAGGLVGSNGGLIHRCYSAGSVTGVYTFGGLACSSGAFVVTASYWDVDTSGQSSSSGGMGRSTVEMKMESTYVGWSCDGKWKIDEGNSHPRLAYEDGSGDIMSNSVYWAGSGTVEDPYLINDANALYAAGFTRCEWDKHFKVTADIDMSGYPERLNMIGTFFNPFTGTFDGNDHTITAYAYRLYVDYPGPGLNPYPFGFFGSIVGPDAAVMNLHLADMSIDPATEDHHSSGGLAGRLEEGTVSGCTVTDGYVEAAKYTGGLVGFSEGGVIENCHASTSINFSPLSGVGGLAGYSSGIIRDCSASGEVRIEQYSSGGLVGLNYGGIERCWASVYVHNLTASCGGLVGWNEGSITESYATGDVRSPRYCGGLVGYNKGGEISNCYARGNVDSTIDAGGLIGYDNSDKVRYCYAAGTFTDPNAIGVQGLCGYSKSLWNCYWDIETSGVSKPYYGKGLTTSEMMQLINFKGFACDGVWIIDDKNDYPRLYWEDTPGEVITSEWYAGGSGEEGDPYLLEDVHQLDLIGEIYCDQDKHFKLIANINLAVPEANGFTRIEEFGSVLDGNGHLIENLTGGALIKIAEGAQILNLGLIKPVIDTGKAALVQVLIGGRVSNCFVEDGSVTATNAMGLLVSRCDGGFIHDCWASGNVTSTGQVDRRVSESVGVGVLVGWSNGEIERCFSAGRASAFEHYAGGLVGNNQGTISNCYSQADVDGELWIGGLTGYSLGVLLNCYATGTVTLLGGRSCQGGSCGAGLTGTDNGFALNCCWDTQTTGMSIGWLGSGLPTDLMQDADTYHAWAGFGWTIDDGNDYPRLALEQKPGRLLEKIPYAGGEGTEHNPYQINNDEQFEAFALYWKDWDKHIQLGTNIDVTEPNMIPVIGHERFPFTGIFDGQNYRINNYVVDTNERFRQLGLFGSIDSEDALIKDLILESPAINGPNSIYVGTIAGFLSSGTIENCHVYNGTLSGGLNSAGGLVARNWGTIQDCSFDGSIQTGSGAGGIAQYNNGLVQQCLSNCIITASSSVGGIVGYNNYGYVSLSGANVWAKGGQPVGGIVGYNYGGTIEYCYAHGYLQGEKYVGGGIGCQSQDNSISISYSTCVVDGNQTSGGFAGCNSKNHVHRCYWDMDASGMTTSQGGVGLTNEQMKLADSFIGWGCEGVWVINEGVSPPDLHWKQETWEPIMTEAYNGGCGTESNPFLISTAEQLNTIGLQLGDYGKNFILTNDIDMSTIEPNFYNPIGFVNYDVHLFTGNFDGKGFSISNFTPGELVNGIFGNTNGAHISNLIIVDPNVGNSDSSKVGALCGSLTDSIVTNIGVSGGLVRGYENVGGLIGKAQASNGTCIVSNCWVDCVVQGYRHVGGIAGENYGAIIQKCQSYANISANDWEAGGIAGHNHVGGEIWNCFASSNVTGHRSIGGLVGANTYDSAIFRSCAMSIVDGNEYVGGLVGYAPSGDLRLTDNYAICDVSGITSVGGLIGSLYDGSSGQYYYLDNCYAACNLSGDTEVGAFIGRGHYYTYVNSCFYDSSIDPNISGLGDRVDPEGLVGLPTHQLQLRSTFIDAGWDLAGESQNGTENIWRICGDDGYYPDLDWHAINVGDFICPDGVEISDLAVMSDEWLMRKLSFDTEPSNGDGTVNFFDFAEFSLHYDGNISVLNQFCQQWLLELKLITDIWPLTKDGMVNMGDFAVLAENWLAGTDLD
ncbi:MAG: GLUG motif-containing protein [Planctomycetota bacterium]|jgi:hypothetical protein